MTQSDDFLWRKDSPTQHPDQPNTYVYRLRFDGDVWDENFETYEDAVSDLKRSLSDGGLFDICQIEQYEVDLFTTDVFYTLDKNEYITKNIRFMELLDAQWKLSSDEVVEKNQLRKYLNFNL
jgi:hypothetical protein